MAMTAKDLPIGGAMPAFSLPVGGDKTQWSSSSAQGKPLLVLFICNHCPYVLHISQQLGELTRQWQRQGLQVVAINSNDPETYPEDAPEKMPAEARRAGYDFPYLFDGEQSVAKAFNAVCTPDIFLFDQASKLFYHGQFDDSRPKNTLPVTGKDLSAAVEAVLNGGEAPDKVLPSVGCSIKWRAGNEPEDWA
ncbi:thioredoxin family protein [Acidithiobacillus marinus]|uniref:Thioredoxin family protein n=1 Tax=Acidithiobacillus marinus TaxID=187490 RepID=A0A2I1DKE3_9PROT|nr:thioredoxin family protein [Acidithiobacillus marinus]PKY10348.1 thioredoxin family protein [Acidithiobacillus marinus]